MREACHATPGFGSSLEAYLRELVRFDHIVVFAYRGEETPFHLYSSFSEEDYRIFVSLYIEGAFRLDPIFVACLGGQSGFRRMRDLAPDRFYSSEYFRSYYVQTGLAEEVAFIVPLPGGVTVTVSLMRRSRRGIFPAREIARLAQVQPVVAALVEGGFAGAAGLFPDPGPDLAGTDPGAQAWSLLGLTPREAAVVELVLQGHSSDSIAGRLSIAGGTVKVHRRNVYRKLGIASQTQLLALYIARVAQGASRLPH